MKKTDNQYIRLYITILLMVVSLFGFSCSNPAVFPKQLIGTWVTDTEQYEDRYIQIDDTKIIFGTGEPVPNIFFINSFESRPFGKTTEWIFQCELKKGEAFTINLLYYFGQDSVEKLQLKNSPQIVWHREEKN